MVKRRFMPYIRPIGFLILIPFLIGVTLVALIISGDYRRNIARVGAERLITTNWQAADTALASKQPAYARKYAYYQVKTGQDVTWLSHHFGVSESHLQALNPGIIVPGTTVKVPPIESPLTPINSSRMLPQAHIYEGDGFVHVAQAFKDNHINATFDDLYQVLVPYGAIDKVGERAYRIMKPVSVEGNIQLDITGDTVSRLELVSAPGNVAALSFEDAEVLIKNTAITSYDPHTGGPDTNAADSRSFVRALKSSRMDIVSSQLAYLGTGSVNKNDPLLRLGAAYGVAWRIPGGGLGRDLATGWVERSSFSKNYFGAYTFGVSGMTFKQNQFTGNEIYGLDPHDDSNNAMIASNSFDHNGKHGLILSKRCDYNIIQGNKSYDNALHGYMLHEASSYNLLENNIAYGNTDNFVIFGSDFNTLRHNGSYQPKDSNLRINNGSTGKSMNNFIIANIFSGGNKGIYLYDNTRNTLIKGNTFQAVGKTMSTHNVQNAVFVDNTMPYLGYQISKSDRIIFGPNTIAKINIPNSQNLNAVSGLR